MPKHMPEHMPKHIPKRRSVEPKPKLPKLAKLGIAGPAAGKLFGPYSSHYLGSHSGQNERTAAMPAAGRALG